MTRLRIALVIVAAILIAHALWLAIADPADADDHGIVVTCADVRIWDVNNLGNVTVTRSGGTDLHRPGNALTVPYVTAAGAVVRVTTAHHTYTVSAPAGCTPSTTTTSTTSTTTTAAAVPPVVTQPPAAPSSTPPPPSSVLPPPTTVGAPPPTTTLPPASPAVPVVEHPAFTG